jgi:asparagine synthase (glutamine-hydrolysing)
MTAKNKMFFSPEVKAAIERSCPEDMMRLMLPNNFKSWPVVARAQFLETRGLRAGYILSSQGDRMAMGNSIEGRFPFLDHRVVEFAATLPLHYKIRALNEKYILKKCMAPYLPASIVKRTKQPYLAPDSKSFFKCARAAGYVEELLSEKTISEYGYFNPKPVALLVNKCKKGTAIGFKDNMALVGILSTQLLHKQFVEDFHPSTGFGKSQLCIVNEPVRA